MVRMVRLKLNSMMWQRCITYGMLNRVAKKYIVGLSRKGRNSIFFGFRDYW